MAIHPELAQEGSNPEFSFRDNVIMPLLVRLGFGIVINYHGQREYGRDVVFGEIDRFGHMTYHGMQIKYEASISLAQSHDLVRDAEEATHNPFINPQSGRPEYVSCFYVANAGVFSDQAKDNFFSTTTRRGIRDAKLLDGNALALLNKSATLNRNANLRERLLGLLQEVRRNRNVVAELEKKLPAFATDANVQGFPMQRCRNTASASYLNAPFPIPGLSIDVVDQYWEVVRMLNDIADSVGIPVAGQGFREGRATGFAEVARQLAPLATTIEVAILTVLSTLGPS